MARKKAGPSKEPFNFRHTLPQPVDAQNASRRLSEIPDLKQHPDAPKIAGYMLLKPIGQGAYAQVWEAVQLRTRKFVAVKIFIKKSGVHWFYLQREADRLIRLDKHPHIVSLLDADLAGEVPYYVMDLAQEGSLDRFVGRDEDLEGPLPDPDAVADWMEEIAQALHYVHAKQMVHCDLKPANVLLDEEGHVRVTDFGNSRVLSESGGALGTLFYMAPEQAVSPDPEHPLQPDPRWDIYALGCTVYAVLSNHVPHEEVADRLEMIAEVGERLRIYRESITRQPLPDLFIRTRGVVDRDLSAIVAKCVKTDPRDRYASIDGVLGDLRNRREGRPVSPLRGDPGYWLGKFVRRYRTSVIVAALSIVVVLLALLASAGHQKAQVQDVAFNYVLRGREFLEREDEASACAYFTASNKIVPSVLAQGNAVLHMPPIPVRFFSHDGSVVTAAYSPDGKVLMTAGGTTGARLFDGATGTALGSPLKLEGPLTAAAFSSDGSKVILGDAEGNAQVFEVASEKRLGRPLTHRQAITSVSFSQDDSRVLTSSADGSARVWDARTGQPLRAVMEHDRPIYSARFNPAGDRVLTVDKEGAVQLWDASNGEPKGDSPKLAMKGAPSWYRPDVLFQPNGRGFLTTGWDGSLRFYDDNGHPSGRPLFLEGLGAKALLSPDGRELLTSVVFGGTAGALRIWNTRRRSFRRYTLHTPGQVMSLAFNRDGSEILAGGTDHVVRVWRTDTGEPVGHAFYQGDVVTAAAFDPNGGALITGSKDGLACLWELEDGSKSAALDWKGSGRERLRKYQVHGILDPAGARVLTYGGKSACLWDSRNGKPLGVPLRTSGSILRAVFSPDGSALLTCDQDDEARLWDLRTSKSIALAHDGSVRGGAFSPDGKRVLTGGADRVLRVWNSSTGQEWAKVNTGKAIAKVLFSPDGSGMAALGVHGSFALYPVAKKVTKALIRSPKGVRKALFSPDGRILLLAGAKAVTLLDPDQGKVLKVLPHGPGLVSVLVSPDGRQAATAGSDGTLRLWDLATGKPVGNPLRHDGPLQDWVFSPHGEALLAAYQDRGMQWWDTAQGETIGEETKSPALERAFGFDGGTLRILGRDGSLTGVDSGWVLSGTDPDRLILESQVAGRSTVNASGSLEPLPADQWVRHWAQYQKEKK